MDKRRPKSASSLYRSPAPSSMNISSNWASPTRSSRPGSPKSFWSGGSPKSDTGVTNDMLDAKLTRKRAETDLQLLANRIALLRMEEQKALQKGSETKAKADEIAR